MSLLEQNITKKERVDNNVRQTKFDADNNNNGEYKVEAIGDSTLYVIKSKSGYLPGLYYLNFWKTYTKEENTWEPVSAIQLLGKLISSFYKNHLDKPTAIFNTIDTAPPRVKSTIRPTAIAIKPTQ